MCAGNQMSSDLDARGPKRTTKTKTLKFNIHQKPMNKIIIFLPLFFSLSLSISVSFFC